MDEKMGMAAALHGCRRMATRKVTPQWIIPVASFVCPHTTRLRGSTHFMSVLGAKAFASTLVSRGQLGVCRSCERNIQDVLKPCLHLILAEELCDARQWRPFLLDG